MSLSDLASIGSFVSGFAVLLSLVFLYFQLKQVNLQVRQTEKNQQALIRQNRATRVVDLIMRRAEGSLVDAVRKGQAGDDDITLTELTQYRFNCVAQFFNLEDTYYQHVEGLLNDAAFASFVLSLKTLFATVGMQAMWETNRPAFPVDFVQFIDKVIAETLVTQSGDALASWKTAIAAKRAKVTAWRTQQNES
jgi:hypothetical protein